MTSQMYAWADPRRFGTHDGKPVVDSSVAVPNRSERFPVSVTKTQTEATPHTYLIGAVGSPVVKIGFSTNPAKRLASLRTGHHQELILLWSTQGDYETALHRTFADWRVRGEWFDLGSLGDPVAVVTAAMEQIRNETRSGDGAACGA